MKYLLLACSLLFASPALAGGPVIVSPEEDEVVVAAEPRSGRAVPIVVGLIIACAIFCGGGNDSPVDPGPICNSGC